MNIAIILAGGFGTRLFPLSRTNYPKQFIKIFDNKSLLQLTYERLKRLEIFDSIWVSANRKHYYLVLRDLNDIQNRIILEEQSKNTAYAILYSIFKILNNLGLKQANLFFFPSDHFIFNDVEFDFSISKLISYIESYNKTFIVGVKPSFASTEYGYIRKKSRIDDKLYVVDKFVEKPSKNRARYYCKRSSYLWNSGIYAFNSAFFIEDFFRFNPELCNFRNFDYLFKNSDLFPNISIDYLYSQKTNNLLVLEANFGWSDLGSFEQIEKVYNQDNLKVFTINSNSKVIFDELENFSKKKYCLIDIDDLIIVDTKDFQLISKKGKSKDISKVIDLISNEQKDFNTFDFRPWGYYREIESVESKYRIKNIVIYPFQELSLQYHNHRDEYWIILKGKGKIILNEKSIDVFPGQFIFIPKLTLHKVINQSSENMEIIEVQIGNLLSENDIIRIDDKYRRI